MRRIVLALLAIVSLPAAALAAFYAPPAFLGAWPTYTPVVSATSGTITAASASGKYLVTGKRVDFQIDLTITTNGDGAQYLQASLPLQAGPTAFAWSGEEIGITGKQLEVLIGGGSSVAQIRVYDGSYPGANGARCIFNGFYLLP